ncbi:MAG: hypothetical protein LBN04_02555 [Oscillospiraceae bacterium]|jgi:hypothetical protein|nr:hypothetical protein [Oscillospiraceae bacterium]
MSEIKEKQGLKEKLKSGKWREIAFGLILMGLMGSLLLGGGNLFGGDAPAITTSGDAITTEGDALEMRLSRVLSQMAGAGRVEVVIHYAPAAATASSSWLSGETPDAGGEPLGVVVVAEGAGDLMVRIELAQAVQTLLRLPADAVEIFKMDAGNQEE